MIPKQRLQQITRKSADCLTRHPWKVWFWGDSIGLEGLLDAAQLTGDSTYLSFVHGLLKGWLPREASRSQFDYTAPGVALLRVYEATGDRPLLDAAYRHADFMAGFRQTTAGAYMRYENAAIELPPELPADHPENQQAGENAAPVADGGPCVFVDSVHFDGPFFAKLYQVTGEERYRRLALDNILPQIELLYDREERLFHHFWIERIQRPNGVLWARGNGWGLLGVVQTLEWVGAEAPDAARLREVLRDTLKRLAALQHSSGAWHTVLNDPESYVESSTAAFFTDVICRAVRLGVIAREDYWPQVELAMRYLLEHIRPDGVLDGVSYETFPSTRPEHYRKMPTGSMSPWGQGPLLAAALSYHESTAAAAEGRAADEEMRAIG